MNQKQVRSMAATSIAILILLYVGFYVVNRQAGQFTRDGLITETATRGQVSDTLQAKGFAIRDEVVLPGTSGGVLNYRVASGTRVSQGGVIADVYQSENDAAAQNQIDSLQREIESLKQLAKPSDLFVSNPAMIGSQIYGALGDISGEIRKNHFSEMGQLKDTLQNALSRKQVIAGEESAEDYELRVQALEDQLASLEARGDRSVGTIEAPRAGYFVDSADGFESVMEPDKVKNITVTQAKELLAMENPPASTAGAMGKICSDFVWKLVCVIPDDEMVKFEGVTDVTLDIPFASAETIPARVVAKNRDSNTGETAVVFECSYMDADLATVRNETVHISVKTYSGVLVSERALRFEDVEYTAVDPQGNVVTRVRENVKGVYVQYAGRLRFVQVFTEKDVNGYAVCRTNLTDEERASMVTDETVQLYDEVVVGGTDLYDGKVVR